MKLTSSLKAIITIFILFLSTFLSIPFVSAQEPLAMAKAEWIQSPVIQFGIQRPPVVFQRDFVLKKPVKSVRLLITSHGIYEGKINGSRIGQDYFAPGFTNYDQELQYQVYNIEPHLLKSENVIEITVGDGWYRGFIDGVQNKFGSDLGLLCALEITYTDRSKQIINSDESWKYGSGPIRYADLQTGEKSDGNRVVRMDGQARIFLASRHQLVPTTSTAIQKRDMLKAMKVTGDSIYDFGQKVAGWVRFSIKGERGDSIVIKHAEALNDNGDLLVKPVGFDCYVLRGGAIENYEPHFTRHDFRYAKLIVYRNGQKVTRLVRPVDIKAIAVF